MIYHVRINRNISPKVLALFLLIQPYLKPCYLPVPSVAAAITIDCIRRNRLLAMHTLGIH